MTTIDEFFSTTEISGALTPEQAAHVLTLDLPKEGETAPVADLADAPAPAPAEPIAEAAAPTTTDEPVVETDEAAILAKDGKHLIPFEKLTEARASAQTAAAERDKALQLAAELQAKLDATQAPNAETPQQEVVDLDVMRGERYEALLNGDRDQVIALDKKISAEERRLAREEADQAREKETAAAAQAEAVAQAARDARSKYPALDHTSDKADKDAIDFVIFKRDSLMEKEGLLPHEALAKAVESAAKVFRWSDGTPAPTTDAKATAAAAAAAAIAAAKAPTPTSLSAIPGGKPGGVSPMERMMAGTASGPERLEAMSNLSREQIENLLNRTL